jgi:N-methylhydantoinase A
VTITDAHVVLGRIPPHLLGGEIPLDAAAAATAIAAVAGPLGLTNEACAVGILEISAWNQANALRLITTKRGLDVRDFPMVTFGGSGSLLACRLMDILDISVVLVPPNPGNVSAYGLLTVDVRNDFVRTAVAADRGLDLDLLAQLYEGLTNRAREALQRQGFPSSMQIVQWSADLRYLGQAFEVRVPCPDGDVTRQWADRVVASFHDAHRALYGYDFRGKVDQAVEWVNLRVTGVGPIPRPKIGQIASGDGDSTVARIGTRAMYCDQWLEAAVFDRAQLMATDTVDGPAVIQEFGSTVPVFPGFRATVDTFGNLIIGRIEAS